MTTSATRPTVAFEVSDLGTVSYQDGLRKQAEAAERARTGGAGTLFLLEHAPTITLGRNAHRQHLLVAEDELRRRAVELHECDRGGDITYHGPGQLVGYPVFLLPEGRRGVKEYVWDLEQCLIDAVAEFGIEARRAEGLRGIWVGDDKLGALGVRIARWVTTHGFALNVTTDLSYFSLITPCGIAGRGVTSLARLLGRAPAMADVKRSVASQFERVFAQTAVTSSSTRTDEVGQRSVVTPSARARA